MNDPIITKDNENNKNNIDNKNYIDNIENNLYFPGESIELPSNTFTGNNIMIYKTKKNLYTNNTNSDNSDNSNDTEDINKDINENINENELEDSSELNCIKKFIDCRSSVLGNINQLDRLITVIPYYLYYKPKIGDFVVGVVNKIIGDNLYISLSLDLLNINNINLYSSNLYNNFNNKLYSNSKFNEGDAVLNLRTDLNISNILNISNLNLNNISNTINIDSIYLDKVSIFKDIITKGDFVLAEVNKLQPLTLTLRNKNLKICTNLINNLYINNSNSNNNRGIVLRIGNRETIKNFGNLSKNYFTKNIPININYNNYNKNYNKNKNITDEEGMLKNYEVVEVFVGANNILWLNSSRNIFIIKMKEFFLGYIENKNGLMLDDEVVEKFLENLSIK